MSAASAGQVRNPVGWRDRLQRARGSGLALDLRPFDPMLDAIARLESQLQPLGDRALTARAAALRGAVADHDDARALAFALVREAARRVLGQRPFDEQVVAGLALDGGAVVEMQTGEGKTLTATMPAACAALQGEPVHVLTFNDYLAGRDAEWMGPVYRLLGLSVGAVRHVDTPDARRRAYAAAVTYVTATEAGFDHLRDQLVSRPHDVVHRARHLAIVDEADSLLIDEARVPLVIAGHAQQAEPRGPALAALVAGLRSGEHYTTDEYERDVELTDAGLAVVESALHVTLHAEGHERLLAEVHAALHAHVLLHRDVDYLVRGGRIEIVDEFTGRALRDRHWPDGLQSALEAKEGLDRRPDGQTLASMTLARYLRGYRRLCGMTGTARDAAEELQSFYGVSVVVIPTHRPVQRVDAADVIYARRADKESAVVAEVERAHATGRPVLVGTVSVAESERLARALRSRGVPCEVLNAAHDGDEARIVAGAGAAGAVTIATNMAGRGTDIRLGDGTATGAAEVAALGGLYVIGTNRHESRRIDLQLRGRAGRQGDPGASRFFLSLEDDLLVRYGIDRLVPAAVRDAAGLAPIGLPLVHREVARAQRIVEGQHREMRRALDRYAAVTADQYEWVMERRWSLVHGADDVSVWAQRREKRGPLVAAAGEAATRAAERLVACAHLDRLWREHLAYCDDLREGIHLVRLGGQDPLERFAAEVRKAFQAQVVSGLDAAVLSTLEAVRATDGRLELPAELTERPSSTWTYLVGDDPFREQVVLGLVGAGGRSMSIYAAAVLGPLFALWLVVERWWKRRDG